MAQFKVAYNRLTKVATVLASGGAIPAGSNAVGTFEHADVEPALKDLEFDTNHVLYQHVRDILYHVNSKTGLAVPGSLQFPDNIHDLGQVTIVVTGTTVPHPADTEGAG